MMINNANKINTADYLIFHEKQNINRIIKN